MMSCSPKELIQNTSLTPEEMAQVGIRSEHIGGDVFQLRGLDVRQKIKNVIAFWRRIAEAHIEDSPATDGTLDRTAAAKAILYSRPLRSRFEGWPNCEGLEERE